MTNKEKIEYASNLSAINLRNACSKFKADLDAVESLELHFHLMALKFSYAFRKGWFHWSLFTKNHW